MSLLLKYHQDKPPQLALAVIQLTGIKVRQQAVQNVAHATLFFYPGSDSVRGDAAIAQYLARADDKLSLYSGTARELALVSSAVERAAHAARYRRISACRLTGRGGAQIDNALFSAQAAPSEAGAVLEAELSALNDRLTLRSFVGHGTRLSLADVALFTAQEVCLRAAVLV